MSLTVQEILFQVSIVCFVAFAVMAVFAVRTFVTKRIRDVLADLSGKKRQEEMSGADSGETVRAARDRGRSAFWTGRESERSEDLGGSGDLLSGGEGKAQKASAAAKRESAKEFGQKPLSSSSPLDEPTDRVFLRAEVPDDSATSALAPAADDGGTDLLAGGEQTSPEADDSGSQMAAGDDEPTIVFAEANDQETTTLVDGEDDSATESEKSGIDEGGPPSDFVVIRELSFYGSDDVVTIGKRKVRQ